MIIEEFKDIRIAYIRRIGKYGKGNKQLMENFKNYLKANDLFKDDATILGIALDNPIQTPENEQRYDVGIIITGREKHWDLPIRNIASGRYAVFDVAHTEDEVSNFWKNIQKLTADLSLDYTKPIIERYAFSKISLHLCEFCVPLK
ncbi:Bacterial transcription activator, effector binding domain [Clostridiales bacterium CHKCI001]|nr:Bacterial transcription activator, effector binding domain [Clostridiales bacterium CHKCI001]